MAPGVVDQPVPGGLHMDAMEETIRRVGERFDLRAVTLATFNPARDQNGRTLQAGLRVIELVREYAG